MSFFPDVYNEDWFFFARQAAARSLSKIGEVGQEEYKPFIDPSRAKREEFGDLLAEGLYNLFESTGGWDFKDQLSVAAKPRFWQQVREGREFLISETSQRLTDARDKGGAVDSWQMTEALTSLSCAEDQLNAISNQVCADFIESWLEDENQWQTVLGSDGSVLSERDALDELGLTTWRSGGYGLGWTASGSQPVVPAEAKAKSLLAASC